MRTKRIPASLFCAVIVAACYVMGCGCGCRDSQEPRTPARPIHAGMKDINVSLAVREPSGVDRKAESVTSGVPLPEGSVKTAEELCLLDKDNVRLPCQFMPLSRWPDGSLKWVLLDF